MVGDALQFCIWHRFKSVPAPHNTTYLILLNLCEIKPQQSEDSKPYLPLGGNAVADWHDRRETNTCGITTSHFPLSPCCPLMCPKSFRMCYIAISKTKNRIHFLSGNNLICVKDKRIMKRRSSPKSDFTECNCNCIFCCLRDLKTFCQYVKMTVDFIIFQIAPTDLLHRSPD